MEEIKKIEVQGQQYGVADMLMRSVMGGNAQVIEWSHTHNMNDYKDAGTYRIKGERTGNPLDDNLPIMNQGSGHTIDGILYVFDSSLANGSGKEDDCTITQFLMLSNRVGGQEGDMYMRSAYGVSKDNLTWKPWEKYQTNMEVGVVENYFTLNPSDPTQVIKMGGGMNYLIDNGIYSGVYIPPKALVGTMPSDGIKDPTAIETFVMVVINNYQAAGDARCITQIKFAVTNGGVFSMEKRSTTPGSLNFSQWESVGGGSVEQVKSIKCPTMKDSSDYGELETRFVTEVGNLPVGSELIVYSAGSDFIDPSKTIPYLNEYTVLSGQYQGNRFLDARNDYHAILSNDIFKDFVASCYLATGTPWLGSNELLQVKVKRTGRWDSSANYGTTPKFNESFVEIEANFENILDIRYLAYSEGTQFWIKSKTATMARPEEPTNLALPVKSEVYPITNKEFTFHYSNPSAGSMATVPQGLGGVIEDLMSHVEEVAPTSTVRSVSLKCTPGILDNSANVYQLNIDAEVITGGEKPSRLIDKYTVYTQSSTFYGERPWFWDFNNFDRYYTKLEKDE